MRGYFAIGIENPSKEVNVGSLWRSAYSFGAQYIFTIGKKYKHQPSDTSAAYKHIPLFFYKNLESFFDTLPINTSLVGIETGENSRQISNFIHPERSIYVLGNESKGLSEEIMKRCNFLIKIPGKICLNVSFSGGCVMFDRISKSENLKKT